MTELRDVVQRYAGNPILTPDMIPGANAVFNSSVARFGDRYVGVFRVEKRQGFQSLRVGWSDDGITGWKLDSDEVLVPTEEPFITAEEARYDPRITYIATDDRYYICHASENRFGCQISVAGTRDFKTFEKIAVAAEPTNRNMVLFPEKIGPRGELYVRLDRPWEGGNSGNMWISYSPDLVYWGRSECIMQSRAFAWDSGKIGPGAPPIRTSEGWLIVYHGITPRVNAKIYKAGVALLDLDDPRKVIARGKEYIMAPREMYERVGDVPNVVFPTAVIPYPQEDEVRIYYGGADTVFCLATAKISELIHFARHR
jgi:beta-1,4-mannooligosaccharide/beta-1,4-mannosyl-N-acetylglucosamine phosphorylase